LMGVGAEKSANVCSIYRWNVFSTQQWNAWVSQTCELMPC